MARHSHPAVGEGRIHPVVDRIPVARRVAARRMPVAVWAVHSRLAEVGERRIHLAVGEADHSRPAAVVAGRSRLATAGERHTRRVAAVAAHHSHPAAGVAARRSRPHYRVADRTHPIALRVVRRAVLRAGFARHRSLSVPPYSARVRRPSTPHTPRWQPSRHFASHPWRNWSSIATKGNMLNHAQREYGQRQCTRQPIARQTRGRFDVRGKKPPIFSEHRTSNSELPPSVVSLSA